jgi:competence protein ComEC
MLCVNWAAALPEANVQIESYSLGALAATYALVGMIYLLITQKAKQEKKASFELSGFHPSRITSPIGLGALALIAILVWAAVVSLPDGRLHLYFLDIGQGDGILVQTPSGRQVLIDGGPTPERLLEQLGEVMPWWDRSIDMVLATHADHDHIGGQEVVPSRYHIDYALETPAMAQDPDGETWRKAVDAAGVKIDIERGGGWIDLGDGVALWVLWPPEQPITGDDASNENSLVTKLVYGNFSVLLTGDAGIPSESTWLAEGLPLASTVLKVGHHGSSHSTSTGLVAAVNPQWAIIQVGANNTYGHPTQAALDALAGHTILRNDLNGRIDFATDGQQVWVETER